MSAIITLSMAHLIFLTPFIIMSLFLPPCKDYAICFLGVFETVSNLMWSTIILLFADRFVQKGITAIYMYTNDRAPLRPSRILMHATFKGVDEAKEAEKAAEPVKEEVKEEAKEEVKEEPREEEACKENDKKMENFEVSSSDSTVEAIEPTEE
jgi:hypothetical protein